MNHQTLFLVTNNSNLWITRVHVCFLRQHMHVTLTSCRIHVSRKHWWWPTHLVVPKAASSRKGDVADVRWTGGRCRFIQQQALRLGGCVPTGTHWFTEGTSQLTRLLLLPEVMEHGHHVHCTHGGRQKRRVTVLNRTERELMECKGELVSQGDTIHQSSFPV